MLPLSFGEGAGGRGDVKSYNFEILKFVYLKPKSKALDIVYIANHSLKEYSDVS